MEPQMLTMIFNIVFYAIIGIIVLKSVIGIFKGVWGIGKKDFHFILVVAFNIEQVSYYINMDSLASKVFTLCVYVRI